MSAPPRLAEADWQSRVVDLAGLRGWRHVHFRAARTTDGWRTPVSGPLGAGFPDLLLVRDRVVFAELKSVRGRVTPEQRHVHDALRAAGAEVHVWRPVDWPQVQEVLS